MNDYNNQNKLTQLSEIGEFGLIDRIKNKIQGLSADNLICGIGDDASVSNISQEGRLVVSTDLFAEGVHFDLVYTPLKYLGFKVISATLSDICAMNAKPDSIWISIALSSKFSVEAIDELYDGITNACETYKVSIAGGDTTSSKSGLIINVTASGFANQKEIVYRNGAKLNDIIVTTGDLGGAYLGLTLLEREKRIFLENPEMQPDFENFRYPIQRQLNPIARNDVKETLKSLDIIPTSMIDISDGLASELNHICKSSNVGGVIFESQLPIDDSTKNLAIKFGIDPTIAALSGGEDYELLFTVSEEDAKKLVNQPDFSIIGVINSSGICELETYKGKRHELKRTGFNHFEPKDENS